MVIIDTNIIIDHLRLRGSKKSKLENIHSKVPIQNLGISTITLQELFQGQSTSTKRGLEVLEKTIKPLQLYGYNVEIAKLAGEITRDHERTTTFADAAIAATAIVFDYSLATLNKKDFEHIKGLVLWEM